MGEGDVGFDGLTMIAIRKGSPESWDGGESADVFVGDAALEDVFSLSVACEKGAMVFLEIGVAMPTRSEH